MKNYKIHTNLNLHSFILMLDIFASSEEEARKIAEQQAIDAWNRGLFSHNAFLQNVTTSIADIPTQE